MGMFDILKSPFLGKALSDNYDPTMDRLAGAKRNLGLSTLFGVLGNFAQNKKVVTPVVDNRYLNRMATEVPQRIKDYENSQIDRTTRGVVQGVLANAPLNRAANTIAVADAQAVTAKANLASNQDKQALALQNTVLQAKQRRLDLAAQATAGAQNQEIQNSNNQLANYGALGTNYYNELQRAQSNEYAISDRNKYLKSQGFNNMAQWLSMFRGKGVIG